MDDFRKSVAANAPPNSWYEDFEHENGMYTCVCSDCGNQFMGHKRRTLCTACSDTTESIKPTSFDPHHGGHLTHCNQGKYIGSCKYGEDDTCVMLFSGDKLFAAVTKDTNPKDAVGIRKWRWFSTVSQTVLWEVGVAMLEGALKYGRHNYRDAGVRASVYVDAAMGHITQWWEGEDIDADSDLSHITKAIASLVVLRDAMIQDKLMDDRPPKANLDAVRDDLQKKVDVLMDKYPEPVGAVTEKDG